MLQIVDIENSLPRHRVENAKIVCAKKLFNETNTNDMRCHEVTNYGDLLAYQPALPVEPVGAIGLSRQLNKPYWVCSQPLV